MTASTGLTIFGVLTVYYGAIVLLRCALRRADYPISALISGWLMIGLGISLLCLAEAKP